MEGIDRLLREHPFFEGMRRDYLEMIAGYGNGARKSTPPRNRTSPSPATMEFVINGTPVPTSMFPRLTTTMSCRPLLT